MQLNSESVGSDTLLLQIRGAFTLKGTSLNRWCADNNIDYGHAHRVLKGATNGEKAKALRATIIAASGRLAA